MSVLSPKSIYRRIFETARLPLLFLALAAPVAGFVGLCYYSAISEITVWDVCSQLKVTKEDPVFVSARLVDAMVYLSLGRAAQAFGLIVGGLAFVGAIFVDRRKKAPNPLSRTDAARGSLKR